MKSTGEATIGFKIVNPGPILPKVSVSFPFIIIPTKPDSNKMKMISFYLNNSKTCLGKLSVNKSLCLSDYCPSVKHAFQTKIEHINTIKPAP